MRFLRLLAHRFYLLLHRDDAERALRDEVSLHLDLETEKNIQLGMHPIEARRQAMLSFGAVEATREEHRDGRGTRWIEEITSDVKFALRTLRRSPALAGAAIITLALGIGANAAIFSVVNAVILRPLPFPAADRLMMIGEDNAEYHWQQAEAAPANYLDWREQTPAFAGVAAYPSNADNATLSGEGDPQLVSTATVTGNFFAVLGVSAEVGRTLEDRETWHTGVPVAVISHRLWSTKFHNDPAVVGRTIMLDGSRLQVVGVMPSGFTFPFDGTDVWTPTAWAPESRTQIWFRRAHFVRVVARLRPGVTVASANAELQTVVRRLQRDYPETNRIMGATMTPLRSFLTRDIRTPLLILLSAVGLLLLLACANVGNLLLVRATGTRRETAVRLALGAGRARLVRQALVESLLLSLLGAAAGLVLGWWGTHTLLALQPAGMLPITNIGMDRTVLGFLLCITIATGLLFGTAPAFWSMRQRPSDALKEGGRAGSVARGARRWGSAMVVAEVALAAVLGLGAGLLVRSFGRLEQVNPGFDPTGVLAVELNLPGAQYDSVAKVVRFYDELETRARALPGVVGVASVSHAPLTTFAWSSDFTIAGRADPAFGTNVVHREITPDYFRVMRVPLLSGRLFTAQDNDNHAPLVVLINDVIARQYFATEDPIGKRIAFDRVPDSTSHWRTIVGVVGSEHQAGPDIERRGEFFEPLAQEGRSAMTLMVRTTGDPAKLTPAIRRTLAAMDPTLAIISAKSMTAIHDESLAKQHFLMVLLFTFAGTGLLLAAVGVYGVMAHAARGRTREVGIRIALGAEPGGVQWLVVREGLRLTLGGLAVGIGAALLATRAMTTLLYDVKPADPLTFVIVPMVLGATALAATWLPAARVSRTDPVTALRTE